MTVEARPKRERRSASRLPDEALPHSIEAERALLGALVVNPELFDSLPSAFTGEAFYRDAHRRLFAAVVELRRRQMAVDLITLRDELTRRGDLDAVGGAAYIVGLTDGMPRSANAPHYATVVLDHATRRAVIRVANLIIGRATSDEPGELLDFATRETLALSLAESRGALVPVRDLLPETIAAVERAHDGRTLIVGTPTGYTDVDSMTGGLQAGNLILLAARPSLGKTSLALNIAANIAESRPVAFFSLEMSWREVMMRLALSGANVDSYRLRQGYLSQSEYGRFGDAFGRIGSARLWVDDTAGLPIGDLRSRAMKLAVETGGLGLVVVDYLQLVTSRERYENRTQEVSAISKALKVIGRELDCPVVALSQLSRAPDGRRDKRPILSDLRESGSLEQDADVVLFLYRAEGNTDDNARTELIVAKQRNGPTGTVNLLFRRGLTTFVNYAPGGAEDEGD